MSSPSDYAVLLDGFADMVAERVVKRLGEQSRGDEFVDRRTAGVSVRQWRRWAKDGTLPVFRDGRRLVCKRSDLVRAVEKNRVPVNARSNDDAALVRAGVRLNGGG